VLLQVKEKTHPELKKLIYICNSKFSTFPEMSKKGARQQSRATLQPCGILRAAAALCTAWLHSAVADALPSCRILRAPAEKVVSSSFAESSLFKVWGGHGTEPTLGAHQAVNACRKASELHSRPCAGRRTQLAARQLPTHPSSLAHDARAVALTAISLMGVSGSAPQVKGLGKASKGSGKV
jgi:hypothetical protein